jgi:hypothetical protein
MRLIIEKCGESIGVLLLGAFIGVVPSYLLNSWIECRKSKRAFRSWLGALLTESEYVVEVIDEAKTQLNANYRVAFTKRLNSDLLEKARLALFELNKDSKFFYALTVAHRNILQTNGMLDRFEEAGLQGRELTLQNVLAALNVVRESVLKLEDAIDVKLGHKPRIHPLPS